MAEVAEALDLNIVKEDPIAWKQYFHAWRIDLKAKKEISGKSLVRSSTLKDKYSKRSGGCFLKQRG